MFTEALSRQFIIEAFEDTDDSDEVQNSNAAEKNPYDLLVGGVKREGVVNSSRSGRFSSTLQEDDP
jgi:hypothetical protein